MSHLQCQSETRSSGVIGLTWDDSHQFGNRGWPVLRDDAVHVWRMSIDLPDEAHRALRFELDDAECERASRYAFRRDEFRFVAARALLRRLLGRYLERKPSELKFASGSHGKPFIAGREASAGLRFSFSHSGGMAMLGVAHHNEIGVDLEQHRPFPDLDAFVRSQFSEAESAEFSTLSAAQRNRGFFDCWTRKEAFVKALGLGLSMPLGRFDVSFAPRHAPALLSLDGCRTAALGWSLFDCRIGASASAAVVVRSPFLSEVSCYALAGPGPAVGASLHDLPLQARRERCA